jgi:putative chitinase
MARQRGKVTIKNRVLGQFKFPESYTSLILGAIVVLVAGILFISFARGNRNMQTSSTKEGPKAEEQKSQKKSITTNSDSKTSSTYTIKPGDDLWSISEDVYKDGYKWVEIARMNKLENPGLIHAGNKLTIPEIEKEKVVIQVDKPIRELSENLVESAINGTTYTIKEGDNLWDISVRAYGDGFKWPEIAKLNNIVNPDLIYPDNVLKIPRP